MSNKRVPVSAKAPRYVWRKKGESEDLDAQKISTEKKPESQACSSDSLKQSTKKKSNSSAIKNSQVKKSADVKQVPKKEPKHPPNQGEVWRKKADLKASKGQSKIKTRVRRPNNSSETSYHITWNGFDKIDDRVGIDCCLCEKDLGIAPLEDDVHETEFSKLPVASIMSCGHVFHHQCLLTAEFKEQDCDPSCVFCDSFNS